MKIAIFHNFLDNIGGAEIVNLTLARELNADIYTTNISERHIEEMGFGDVLPRIHSIGRVPIQAPFRHQLSSYRFRRLNLSKIARKTGRTYDFFIIAGDWAMSGAVNNKPNLWYVHSPMHEVWALKDFVKYNLMPFWKRPIYDMWVWMNRKLTLKYSKHVQKIACNSANTAGRIKKYYGMEGLVVTPPTYTSHFTWAESQGYWLAVNRIVKHKNIEVQMEAFAKLKEMGSKRGITEKIIMVCSYEKESAHFEAYKKELEAMKPDNVEMISWVPYDELLKLYSRCKGFITTAMQEDFGLTVIEAMAAGKPVIATNEGGYTETMIEGKTGILISDITADKLADAVLKINGELAADPLKYRDACQARAREFDVSVFMGKIRALLK